MVVVKIAFLYGQQRPTVESANADFGVAKQELCATRVAIVPFASPRGGGGGGVGAATRRRRGERRAIAHAVAGRYALLAN